MTDPEIVVVKHAAFLVDARKAYPDASVIVYREALRGARGTLIRVLGFPANERERAWLFDELAVKLTRDGVMEIRS